MGRRTPDNRNFSCPDIVIVRHHPTPDRQTALISSNNAKLFNFPGCKIDLAVEMKLQAGELKKVRTIEDIIRDANRPEVREELRKALEGKSLVDFFIENKEKRSREMSWDEFVKSVKGK